MNRKAQVILEVTANFHLATKALDAAGLAGWHLAEESLVDWVVSVREACNLKNRMNSAVAHVPGRFGRGAFCVSRLKRNHSPRHDSCGSWNLEIHRKTADHI